MSKEELVTMIVNSVQSYLGSSYHVTVTETLKNNGLKLTGVVIRKDGGKIFPVIYIDHLLSSYASVDDIVSEIIRLYDKNNAAETQFDISFYGDFESCKGRIIFQMVNTERNSFLLQSVPSVKFLDFSIIFKLLFEQDREGVVSAMITNKIMDAWNMTADMLYETALANTPVLQQYRFESMGDMLARITGDDAMTGCNAMYILTNSAASCGCGCILYPHLLESIGEHIGMDFYILPSSIHEVLLVPAYEKDYISRLSLIQIVRDVNRSCVAQEDFLSDSVYLYSRKNKKIKII